MNRVRRKCAFCHHPECHRDIPYWTPAEILRVVRMWISVGEEENFNGLEGTWDFWEAICVRFNNEGGPTYRDHDMIFQKWRQVHDLSKRFHEIYYRTSGNNEEEKRIAARSQFLTEMRQDFPNSYETCWEVLRNNPKWIRSL